MLLQIFKVEKNYFSIKGLKTKGLKNLAGEESVKESGNKTPLWWLRFTRVSEPFLLYIF